MATEDSQGGVLSKEDVMAELKHPPGKGLVITPLLNPDQITEVGVDIRLGHEFIVTRKSDLSSFDLLGVTEPGLQPGEYQIHRYQIHTRKRRKEAFILHPQEFVLGASLEYLSLPTHLYAQVLGKSSLGRVGLIIATAIGVGPGFKGVVTLELSNVGTVPLRLYPGMRIAQLVFFQLQGKADYKKSGRYQLPTGPQFSKLNDPERDFWGGGDGRTSSP